MHVKHMVIITGYEYVFGGWSGFYSGGFFIFTCQMSGGAYMCTYKFGCNVWDPDHYYEVLSVFPFALLNSV